MLTIIGARVINGYTVYQDDQNELDKVSAHIDAVLRGDPIAHPDGAGTHDAAPPVVKHFYVLPKDPQIARDASGFPIFSLVLYRKQAATLDPDKVPRSGDAGGGILTFTVELGVPDDDFNKIKSQLRNAVFGESGPDDPTQDIDLQYVDFIDGKVTVAVEGESTADDGTGKREFVVSAIGSGKISGVGNNRKAIMVKLNQDGAVLMADSKKLTTLPINVSYELTYEYRLLGIKMTVWCDVTSSFHLLQTVFHEEHEEDSGYLGTSDNQVRTDKVTSVTQLFVRNKTAGVEVDPGTSQIDPDTMSSLRKQGMDILTQELEKVQDAAPPPATMDVTYLTKYYSDVSSQLNLTVDQRMVLTRLYTPSANVSNVFTGIKAGDMGKLVAYVELDNPFYALLTVPVRVNADFTKLPISSVTVTLTYQSMKPDQSGPEVRTQSFNFTDGQTIQTFVAYANALNAELTYTVAAEVHYTDSQDPYRFTMNDVTERFLVVDVGTLGLISVDILVGLVVFDDFPEAEVSLRYQRRAGGLPVEKSFILTKDKQTALWTDIIKEESTGSYQYKVDWLRKDGTKLSGTWAPSTSLRLVVDAPVPQRFDITGVCVGNFKDGADQLSTVLLALHYADPDNKYVQDKQLQFLQDGQLLTWTVDLRNPSLRDYQYRFSKIYKGGVVKNVPPDNADGSPAWLPGPAGFITVGEHYFLNVNLFPYLLTFGDREKVVQVDLTYNNPTQGANVTNSFIFNKDNNQAKVWRVQGDDTWEHNYTVAVTYFSANGETIKVPAVAGNSDTFVIPPAPAKTS